MPLLCWCLCSDLDNNQLTGAIPESLGSLSSLRFLCAPIRLLCAHARARAGEHAAAIAMLDPALLLHCTFGDTARWLLSLPRLFLCRYLINNQLTGAIPDSLGLLSRLQYLCAPICLLCLYARARDSMQLRQRCLLRHCSCAVHLVTPPVGSYLYRACSCAGTSSTTSSRARSRTG